ARGMACRTDWARRPDRGKAQGPHMVLEAAADCHTDPAAEGCRMCRKRRGEARVGVRGKFFSQLTQSPDALHVPYSGIHTSARECRTIASTYRPSAAQIAPNAT